MPGVRRNETVVQTFSSRPGLIARIKNLSDLEDAGVVSVTIRKALSEYLDKRNA